MATNIQPIGFLSSVGGNRNGIGENYVKKLDAAGRPSVTFTNDDFGGISDAIALLTNGSRIPHLSVFRVVKTADESYAVPNYNLSPKDAAIEYKNRIQPELPKEVNDNRQHIWILLGNELDDNRADWLGHWSYESALLWNQEGYKVGMVGWNSGEPEPEAWKTPGQVKYLTYCSQHPDQAAVNVHEYSFTVDSILDGYPYKVGRFQFLFKACDELGIPRVPVLIGEWGWTLDNVPDRDQARREIRDVANLYSQFPQILGAGIWYLGDYHDIANKAQRLIAPVGEDAAGYVSGPFSRELIIDPNGGVKVAPAETPIPSVIESPIKVQEPRPSSITEIGRQTIPLPEDAGDVRLEMSQRSNGDWIIRKTITERLDGAGRLEIVFLQGASDTTVETPDLPVKESPASGERLLGTKVVTANPFLHMRTGPSTRHNSKMEMKTGTVVEVMKEGEWDYIRVGSITGYASSQYLSSLTPVGIKYTGVEEDLHLVEPPEFRFLFWPTDVKRVNQHFGERPEFYHELSKGYLPAHEGIDLAAPYSTPYYCVAPGLVKRVSDKNRHGKSSAYGWHVLIDHGNGYSTLYAHATPEIRVTEGDRVSAGQILAYSGSTGNSDGPHLHLTLKKEGYQLDGWPAGYMDPWPFLEPLFNNLRPPMGNLNEGYLYASSLDIRGNQIALAKLNLNLRELPDSNSQFLAKVPQGSPVRILSERLENGYYYCETGIDMEAQPKKVREAPKIDKFDLLDYIKGDGRGRSYEVKNAWGSQERFQIQEDGQTFYLVKNSQWEQFLYDGDFIYRDIDTSPGSGRYYRLKDPDRQQGTRWLRRRMAVGEIYTQPRRVQFYNKDNGSPLAENSGDVTDNMKLVAHHKKYKFQTGIELDDVLELHWVKSREDHTPKEKYFYARGLGMVSWARGHEDPNSPSWSAVAEIHEPGAREPFVRERVTIL